MTKHKSPWRIETNSMGKVAVICSADGWPIARMVEDSDKESAALMAAAPGLLEALKKILVGAQNQGPHTGMSWFNVEAIAQAAIDKAEGK